MAHTCYSIHSVHAPLMAVQCVCVEEVSWSLSFLYRRAPNHPVTGGGEYNIEPQQRQVLDVLRPVTLLCLTHTSLFLLHWIFFYIFFAQWSDLACSEWLVSPSGDVGLNSRV